MLDVTSERGHLLAVIVSFKDADAELLWREGKSQRIPSNLRRLAWKKMAILNAAVKLSNLSVPPGNRLEALTADRKGQQSIRINDQYGVCFTRRDHHAYEVEVVDSH